MAGLRYGDCRRRHRSVSLEAYQRLRRRASASFHGEDEEGLMEGEGEGDGASHLPTDSGGGGIGGAVDGTDGAAGWFLTGNSATWGWVGGFVGVGDVAVPL